MSIKQTLFLGILGLMLITVSSIMVSTYQTTEDVLIGHAHALMESVSGDAIDRSIGFLQPAELAAELTQKLANHDVVSNLDIGAMERYFFEQLKLYPQFSGIYYGAPDGGFVYVMRDEQYSTGGFRTKIIDLPDGERRVRLQWRSDDFKPMADRLTPDDEYDPRVRPWYTKAITYGDLVWTEPYIFFTSKQPGITTSSPVRHGTAQQTVDGVIGVDIEISQISTFLASLRIGRNGSAFIIDTRGQVLAHPRLERVSRKASDPSTFALISEIDDPIAVAAFESLDDSLDDGLDLSERRITRFFHERTAYQAVFTPFQQHKWPWLFAVYVPEDDYLGVFKQNQRNNILLALAITLVASLFGIGLARSMGKPIALLGHQSRAIMHGDWSQPPITTRYTEIRQTADAFSAMSHQLEEQQRLNKALNKTLQHNSLATIFRLSQAAEYKNPMPDSHWGRMAQLAAAIAHAMGQKQQYCELLLQSAPMHDIGNLGIPDEILMKPGKLTSEEWEIVKTHVQIGGDILKNPETEMLSMARNIALGHHEKWNGYGYPKGLAGNEIPLECRICALADAFDTMVSPRVYKPAIDLDSAFREVVAGSRNHFDPDCVAAFMRIEAQVRRIYSTIPSIDDYL